MSSIRYGQDSDRKLGIVSSGATQVRLRRTNSNDSPIPGGDGGARIGPNAILQTLRSVEEAVGREAADRLAQRCGFPTQLPPGLIPESWFLTLVAEVRAAFPPAMAEAILGRSGTLTAAYVTRNRIPAFVRVLLRVLPVRLALPLLQGAIGRNAWTFAGSGRFRVEGPYPGVLILEGAPTCRPPGPPARAGSYYEAAFRDLLALAAPGVRVREVACQGGGDPACRFRIELPSSPIAGEPPCASS